MDFKPLIDYSQPKPQRRKVCPWIVGYVIFTVAAAVLLVCGLQMRGVL